MNDNSQIELKMTKEKFLEKLHEELATGRVIITAWYDDVEDQVGWASIIVSYKDKAEEEEIENLLREFTDD
jgi:hypothetical protein